MPATIHSSAATPSSIAAGPSSVRVIRNGGGNDTSGALPGARIAAASAGIGANASAAGMRSRKRRDRQANSITSGAARAATSNASAVMITTGAPEQGSVQPTAIEELPAV